MYTVRELASLLSPVGRHKMAFRYFANNAEIQKLSDGRTYIEALTDFHQSGRSNLQATLLYQLVLFYQGIQKEWLVLRVDNTRSLEDVLCFLESRGLSHDSETVNIVRRRLRKKQSPKA